MLRRLGRRLKNFLWNVPEGTWLSHAGQGLAVAAVAAVSGLGLGAAAFALAYHFGAREIPGIASAARDGDTEMVKDGIFDLFTPFMGLAVFALLFGVA